MRRQNPRFNRSTLAIAVAALVGALAASPAHAASCTWNTVAGNWNALANWLNCVAGNGNPAGVPGSSDSASIGAAGVVTVNTAQSILNLTNAGLVNIDAASLTLSGGLTTNTGGVISVANGAVLSQLGSNITGGTINTTGSGRLVASNSNSNILNGVTLNGTMDLASATMIQRIQNGLTLNGTVDINANSVLSFAGNQTLGGNGTIVLGNTGGSNRALSMEGNTVLTIGSGVVVRGQNGTLGQAYLAGGNQSIVNNGRIAADVAGGSISLAPGAGVTNNGVLEAQNGGTLVLNSDVAGTGSGSIVAGVGSIVIQNGVALSGLINTSGTGSFRSSNSNSNVLNGVTFNGSLDLASGTYIERVTGGLTLNGAININNNSVLSFIGDQTLGGNGTLVLGNTGSSNRALSMEGNTVLTIGSNVVVRGENGTLGGAYLTGGNQRLINNGLISADVLGGTISLAPGNGITNQGIIEAKNGGTLVLNSDVVGALGSVIRSAANSSVVQNGVALSGVINTSGDGNFRASNSNSNFLNGVTFNGALDLASGTYIERVTGGLTLNGTVNINNNSVLSFNGDQTLGGNGTLVLGNTGSSNRALSMEGNTVLTIGSSVVVRGENGTVGSAYLVGGNQRLVNNGRIAADVAGGTISLAPGNGITNNGLLEAQNGGTLTLSSDVLGTASGSIVAGVGSTVIQNAVTLSGLINTSGSGTFRSTNSNSNFLNGVTFNGALDLASGTFIERVTGGLTLNGTVNINNNSVLSFGGDQTLNGTGSIVLGSTGSSNRALSLEGSTALTIGSGISISGENGTVGGAYLAGGSQTLINNGSIQATVGGGTIILTPTLVQNAALLGATNGGTLRLDGDVTQTGAGQINAANASTVHQNAVTITGGVINTSSTGRLAASNSNSNILSGVTLAGTLDLSSATGIERVFNGLTLNGGTISLNNNSVLSFNGDQTLGGTGTLVLGNTGGSNRALSLEGNSTLTVASGVVLRGHNGTVGQAHLSGGTQNIVNNGAIISDGGGLITVTPTALVNNGLLRAQAGTLTIESPLTGTGTLQVDTAGVINLANGAKTQGQLVMGAAGAALNLGTGNLTITGDYTNVGAGTGNSFNRRAGVTGTGQIVAGTNAAQVITGTGVTGGNTANATLTIGNVRVGANTINYQMANTGTTGPTLRGAIQTSVNGGNISDGRLSGAGVTSSNYSAGAPASNGGNLAVVFTAASAGTLAPLTGQVLNLRSNFENIADQKLNIVLSGAAAAYNAAVGSAAPSPVVVANQRVGGISTTALTISNTAVASAFSEDLNASVAGTSGAAGFTGGNINGLLAGASNNATIGVRVDTLSAGAKAGTVTLDYQTAGTVNGVSNGLGTASAGSQLINVSGNVYQLAAGSLQTAALSFGTLQVGQTVNQNLVVRNTATGAAGFVEDLLASFGASGNSQITGSGSLSGILAGTNSTAANGSMTVSVTGTTVGALNSSIAVNYTSQGAVAGVSNGLGVLGVGSEAYGVSGVIQTGANVINQAMPVVNNPVINLGAVRVGAVAPTGLVSVTNQATVAPQAALNASIAPTSGPITASGGFSLLNPGATNNTSLQVALNTATAGNFTGANAGQATLTLVSDANNVGNCAPNCQLNLPSQVVSVAGKVYTAAVGQAATTLLDFGIVRVGDTVSARNIVVDNTAAASALNDSLRANLAGISGPFGGTATVGGVGAGNSGNIAVTLNTASNGVFSQAGTISFLSQNPDMADVSAGADSPVTVQAQVNALAYAQINQRGGQGTLSAIGSTFFLDFGNVTDGQTLSSMLDVSNQVTGPADLLNGMFDVSGASGLLLSGFNAFTGLLAGADTADMTLGFVASGLGQFQREILFNGLSVNASDPTGVGVFRNLVIRASVGSASAVPEPGSLALVLAALAAGLMTRRRVAARVGP